MQAYPREQTESLRHRSPLMLGARGGNLSPSLSPGMKRPSLEHPIDEARLLKKPRHSEDNFYGQQQQQQQAFDFGYSGSYTGALGTLSGAALHRYLSETQAGPALARLPYHHGMVPGYRHAMTDARIQLASQASLLDALSTYPPRSLGLHYGQHQPQMWPLDTLSALSSLPEAVRAPEMFPRRSSTDPDKERVEKKRKPAKQLPLSVSADCGEDHHAHYSKRNHTPLSIEEDPNWLSELQCFVRTHLLEVCWASREDVAVRNSSKKVSLDQVGIRCRFCAHHPPGSRAQRSSAFPSSIPQLYQSFTMMLRDHFDNCACIPVELREKFAALKSATCQGATEAKRYWTYSAMKLGMSDSEEGIIMNDNTRAAAQSMEPFGHVSGEDDVPEKDGSAILLVNPTDQEIVSEFLYTLVSHFQKVELLPSERKGNRKSLATGLPGFGCRYCTQAGRFGMSRVFPARRRTLPVRIADLYDHICRCNLCPTEDRIELQRLRAEEKQNPNHEKKFLDIVWKRLGHTQANP